MKMIIRQETSDDFGAVSALIKAAFASAEHRDGSEQDLVASLRNSSSFVPELSLIAEIDGEIVGHILFTEALVGGDTALALAPLSVSPPHQRKGIGAALIAEGHRIAGELGYAYVIVLGSETYYPRAGYLPAAQFGIEIPEGFPPENFMAIKLQEDAPPIKGAVAYPEAFGL